MLFPPKALQLANLHRGPIIHVVGLRPGMLDPGPRGFCCIEPVTSHKAVAALLVQTRSSTPRKCNASHE